MKKKQKQQQQQQQHGSSGQVDQEIIKAVAQAWYAKSSSSKSMASEFDTHRRNFKSKPSRFKLEAMKKAASSSSTSEENGGRSSTSSSWDFGESLWDSYEIVAISKRLERGLVLDHFLSSEVEAAGQHVFKKRKESKNSLRNILNKVSSRRFDEPSFAPNDWH